MKKKKSRKCHIRDSTESMGLGAIVKNLRFTRTESKKNKLQGAKPKVPYITGGKDLLTQLSIRRNTI